ncbi:MAG: thioredoxin family protein [Lutimonas sp.]
MAKFHLFITVLFISFATVAQNWQYDLNVAMTQASEGNKPIILVFQGSDWCAPCMKLDREIWKSEDFINYAESHFVMLKADFPKKKSNLLSEDQQKKNNTLAEKYNPNGYFPLVVLLDKNGKVLGTTGYEKITPKEYIDHLESFMTTSKIE